jgi:TolB-like protein
MISKRLAVILLALAVAGAAFAKDNLAVLPFTGGTEDDGETIAELFSFSRELNAVFTPIPRTSITRAIESEWKFQADAGMTDPDTIMAIGKQLGANYVVAGNIGKLGNQNLLTIAILKIDDLRQVAGDVQTYVNIQEIQNKLPDMARNIIEATKIDASRLEKLAITPVQLGRNIDARVADTLAQVLSINLIKSGKYAVYPRTATLEQAQAEYDNQGSGITADENMVDRGKGENPRLVLSIAARRLGDQNMFNAAIINLESGAQVVGESVNYQTLDDGITTMGILARKLTTTFLTSSLAESLAWLSKNATDGGNYTVTLKRNETLAPTTLSYNGKKVSITLDGGTAEWMVSMSSERSLFTVEDGVTLTLGNNVSLRGWSDNTEALVQEALVQVNSGGTLVMESGSKISGNYAYGYGGGVHVGSSGTFTMSGGTISGNYVFTYYDEYYDEYYGGNGGGVYVDDDGTFTMSGGTISGNSAESYGGGGVYVGSSGTFTMSGGTISGNSATDYGGGVDMNGTFTQSGGEISGNSAGSGGGGMSVDGTFTQSGGTISGNSAEDGYGGGVFVASSGRFTKQAGGSIYGSDASGTLKNTATNGHAVYVEIDKSSGKKRNSTAGSGVTLDGKVSGFTGGWE